MPENSCGRSEGPAAAASGEDRLGALPDDALLRVLSLLPSEDAVRTCALARRWRHLWRSTPALRVDRGDGRRWDARWLHRFVTTFFRLRDGRAPLDECDIYCRPFGRGQGGAADEAFCFRAARKWIRYAVTLCGARVLKVAVYTAVQGLELPDVPLISQHLTKVDLYEVELESQTLDLSGCPALEDLEMSSCSIGGEIILLPSVKRLKIIWCRFNIIPRTSISAPRLVSLQLSENSGFTPLGACHRWQQHSSGLMRNVASTVLRIFLEIAVMFICRRDFKWCPIFSKLKTLLLNEWCVAADFSALVYFLQHSPVLEKLTLQLYKEPEPIVEASGCYNAREGYLVSKHLKIVEVKYHEDEVLNKLLMILDTCGVSPEKVAIRKSNSRSSER